MYVHHVSVLLHFLGVWVSLMASFSERHDCHFSPESLSDLIILQHKIPSLLNHQAHVSSPDFPHELQPCSWHRAFALAVPLAILHPYLLIVAQVLPFHWSLSWPWYFILQPVPYSPTPTFPKPLNLLYFLLFHHVLPKMLDICTYLLCLLFTIVFPY